MNPTLSAVCLGAVAVLLAARPTGAVEILPASVPDILGALGADAKGLHIPPEAIPDLFTLTASRIEEDPQTFIVVQPYMSGRWRGGRAVIEYARDLSYTLVSVYDKTGRRQRIYSVRSEFNQHQEKAQVLAASPIPVPTPAIESVPEEAPEVPIARVSWRPARQPAVPTKPDVIPAVVSSADEAAIHYEWDEAKGLYVPAKGAAVVVPLSEAVTEEPRPSPPQETAAPLPRTWRRKSPPESVAQAPHPAPVHPKGVGTPAAFVAAVAGAADSTVWVPSASAKRIEEKPPRRTRVKAKEEARPVPVASGNEDWVPKSIQAPPGQPAPTASQGLAVGAAPTPDATTTLASARDSVAEGRRGAAPPSVDSSIVMRTVTEEGVPSTEELLGVTAPSSKVVGKPAIASVTVGGPAVTSAKAPKPEASLPASAPIEGHVPSEEELIASPATPHRPDTTESDAWVPKETPRPARPPEPEEPAAPKEPMKVASIPKPVPVDNSIEALLKTASQTKAGMPAESDAWVPKETPLPKPDAEINAELARLQKEKKKPAPPVIKVRRDVNNPEEGVLPVSSFEKFSGPMYGRHREYERRFFPGKRPRAKVSDHDFYVDEVDRKKEIHNIYYYKHQTSKAPKLVAVERHDKVSFMNNYDIAKEDKGKINTY